MPYKVGGVEVACVLRCLPIHVKSLGGIKQRFEI